MLVLERIRNWRRPSRSRVNKDSGARAKRQCARYDAADQGPDQEQQERGKKEGVAGAALNEHQRAPPTMEDDESLSAGGGTDAERLKSEANGAALQGPASVVNAKPSEEDLEQRMMDEKEYIRLHDTATCEVWYLVDVNWLQSWKSFVTRNGALPGPIDNGRLVDERTGMPWRGLKPVDDYRGVNEAIWMYWRSRYGGGPTVKRQYLDLYNGYLDDEVPYGNSANTRQSPQQQHEVSLPGAAASGAEASSSAGAGGPNRADSSRNQQGARRPKRPPDTLEERSQGSSSSSGGGAAPGRSVSEVPPPPAPGPSTTTPRRSTGVETLTSVTASVRNRIALGSSRGSANSRNKGAGGAQLSGNAAASMARGPDADDDEEEGKDSNSKPSKPPCCDKCDGPHETDKCPHFKKAREKHADAWCSYGKSKNGQDGDGDGAVIVRSDRVRVVAQPGDGSCLFHSLSYGLSDGSSASSLRQDICRYIGRNPDLTIADTSIKDWVLYASNESVATYAERMKGGAWGGGIEMAALMSMRNVNVHVYEKCREGYRRISAFEQKGARKTVSVLYQGRNHYDAIVVPS